jgi:hypothetical protein
MSKISRRSMMGTLGTMALSSSFAPYSQSAPTETAKTYKLTRDIPVEEGYDLVVAGGGPAGAAAAISAARLGGKVLLVETTGCMGGMGTSGFMMGFIMVGDGERCLTGGLMREYIDALYHRGFLKPGLDPSDFSKQHMLTFNAEGLKLLLDEMAVAAKVDVRFYTTLIDVDAEPRAGHVRGVVIQNIEGYRYIRASAFIDGTGNGVLAKLCGAKCKDAGRDTPGIMPPTLVSLCSGIDWKRMGDQHAALNQANKDHFFEPPDLHMPGLFQTDRTVGLLNAGHIYNLDALRCQSMTEGMMRGRRLAQQYVAFYRKYVPGCENLEHVATAPLMGLRESRHVLGEYELNIEDYSARRQFPDQIAVYNYAIDMHAYNPSPEANAVMWKTYLGKMKPGESVGLPYGMIVVKGWKNLWVAGRCASMDLQVHGAFRVQPAAVMMGQAAGTAAVQSVRTSRPAAEIDTEVLVNTLRKAGAYLPQAKTSKTMTRNT